MKQNKCDWNFEAKYDYEVDFIGELFEDYPFFSAKASIWNIIAYENELLALDSHKNDDILFNPSIAEMLQNAEDFSSFPNLEADASHSKP